VTWALPRSFTILLEEVLLSLFSKKNVAKKWRIFTSADAIGSSGSWQLPLANRDPKHPTKTFAPLFLHKYFMFSRQNHAVFHRL
jgi:hypothetical protein